MKQQNTNFKKQTISPSKISGLLKIPASKSYMQRTVLAALLSNGISEIENPCYSDDSKNILKVVENLGAEINKENNKIFIKGGISPINNTIAAPAQQHSSPNICPTS